MSGRRSASSGAGPFAQPQELVLTLLGSYVHPRAVGTVWSGGLAELLTELGFSHGAARIALTRLVHRDLLARSRHGRLVHYTLTQRAIDVLSDGDRRIFSLGKGRPGGAWTVLWHSIPPEQRLARERLVRRLRFLGFGTTGDGTWLAPHDLEREVVALLTELDVMPYAGLLRGTPSSTMDIKALVGLAWDLDQLASQYAGFVAEFTPHAAPDVLRAMDDREAFAVRTRLMHAFRQFPFRDPELPPDLVQPPPQRVAAVELFEQLYAATEQRAQRHFDALTITDSQAAKASPARMED